MTAGRHHFSKKPRIGAMLVTVAAMATIAIPSATAAVSGQSYVAEIGSGGHVSVVFSRDGRQVTRAFVGYTYKCSDGTSFPSSDSFKSLPVSARGVFTTKYDSGVQTSSDGATTFQASGSVTGTRSTKTGKVTGTIQFKYSTTEKATGATITCDTGAIKFSAKD